MGLFKMFYTNAERMRMAETLSKYKTLKISTGINTFNFKIKKRDKQQIMKRGYEAVLENEDLFLF